MNEHKQNDAAEESTQLEELTPETKSEEPVQNIPEEITEEFASIDEVAKDSDINFLDFEDIPDLQDININENLGSLDEFEDVEALEIPQVEEISTEPKVQPEDNSVTEEAPSLMEAVKNEGVEIMNEPQDLTDLEAFETPID